MNVRRASAGDEARLRSLRLQALADSPTAFASTYEREASRTDDDWRRWIDSGATFFAEGDGEPAGLVAVYRDLDDPTLVRLVSMWLHPAARGSGAADALLGAAIAWAEEQGGRAVRLCVIKGNVAARRVYQRHGFRFTGECVARDADELTELQMERALTS